MPKIECFEKNVDKYDAWFERNQFAYKSELEAIRHLLPESGTGFEIGVGTGRYAAPLGIKFGIEPSKRMREIAQKRGINVIDGIAESLPFENDRFDFALMVTTICFLDDMELSFREVFRVLKPKVMFVIGFIDRNSPIGKKYRKIKDMNIFYKVATFYSVEEVVYTMEKSGFKHFSYIQTLFHELNSINDIEPVKEGYGEGSFLVIRGVK